MAAIAALIGGARHQGDNSDVMDLGEQYFEVIKQAFNLIDTEGRGCLDRTELRQVWRLVFPKMTENELGRIADMVYQDLDPNQDGHVLWYEVEQYFLRDPEACVGEPSDVDRMLMERMLDKVPTCREKVWAVVAGGDAPIYLRAPSWLGPLSKIVFIICNGAILASIANFIISTLPSRHSDGVDRTKWPFALEACCIAIFTVEFGLRTASCPSQHTFWRSFFTWVDILAIIPFYIGLIHTSPTGPLVVLRVLRLLRLLRLLKLGRNFEAVQVFLIALGRTAYPLVISMGGVNIVAITLFASLIVSAERQDAEFDDSWIGPDGKIHGRWVRDVNAEYGDSGQPIYFQSVPVAMWWAWVTLTTVGYGDMYPQTAGGRAVASITMCAGLILMAFPLTLLASSFAEVADELRSKKMAKIRATEFMKALVSQAADVGQIMAAIKDASPTDGVCDSGIRPPQAPPPPPPPGVVPAGEVQISPGVSSPGQDGVSVDQVIKSPLLVELEHSPSTRPLVQQAGAPPAATAAGTPPAGERGNSVVAYDRAQTVETDRSGSGGLQRQNTLPQFSPRANMRALENRMERLETLMLGLVQQTAAAAQRQDHAARWQEQALGQLHEQVARLAAAAGVAAAAPLPRPPLAAAASSAAASGGAGGPGASACSIQPPPLATPPLQSAAAPADAPLANGAPGGGGQPSQQHAPATGQRMSQPFGASAASQTSIAPPPPVTPPPPPPTPPVATVDTAPPTPEPQQPRGS